MAAKYTRWLQSPSTGDLTANASLNYITTTTSISEPTAILKHLTAQAKQLEKKEEKILFTIESDNGCCLETITTLKFRSGGGAYLPGMDSNMLDERVVTFPLLHVVTYGDDGNISQIRLYWDQATLLRQVEAIGKSGRNWPVRDGEAQVTAVTRSVRSSDQSATRSSKPTQDQEPPQPVARNDHQRNASTSVIRDPHASLTLFAERDPNEDGRTYSGPKYETAKSAKPIPRDYGELFANDETAAALGKSARSSSTHKSEGTILKAGAGKYFSGNRLFDTSREADAPRSPERKKTYNQKYEHFAFGDGDNDDSAQEKRPKSNKGTGQHRSTFNFEDFSTPLKHVEKYRPDDERHWGAGVDADDPPDSPPKRPIVHAARKDAETHWQLTDQSPLPQKTTSLQRQKGMSLYHDPVYEDERASTGTNPHRTANANEIRRSNDLGAQYEMTDDSPVGEKTSHIKRGARTDLSAHWGFGSQSPEVQTYKTSGDGMGSRKGARSWGIGDDSDPEVQKEKQVRSSARARNKAQSGAEREF